MVAGAPDPRARWALMPPHTVGTREEWRRARLELLAREKELTRRSDELARSRRELPWVPLDKQYRFETPDGTRALGELFDGRSQLLVYHFMFAPEWNDGCPGCTAFMDQASGAIEILNRRDVTMLCVSRAPLDKLDAYRQRRSWTVPWVSSQDSDFNYDFGVSFTEHQQAGRAEYNFRWIDAPLPDLHGLSAFALDHGVVYHTYSCYARGTDVLSNAAQLLDRVPKR